MDIKTALKKKFKMSKPKAGKPAAAELVSIDYPTEGEQILPGHYAVRVAAPAERKVELSFDGKQWHECRSAAGYYWSDWWPTGSGRKTITARCWLGGRRVRRSEPRSCWIVSSNNN